jgi:hypothetical protein
MQIHVILEWHLLIIDNDNLRNIGVLSIMPYISNLPNKKPLPLNDGKQGFFCPQTI